MVDDPHLWLEEIHGDDALTWVRERNETTVATFSDTRFEQMRTEALEVLDTDKYYKESLDLNFHVLRFPYNLPLSHK